jgi:hypothetical protein
MSVTWSRDDRPLLFRGKLKGSDFNAPVLTYRDDLAHRSGMYHYQRGTAARDIRNVILAGNPDRVIPPPGTQRGQKAHGPLRIARASSSSFTAVLMSLKSNALTANFAFFCAALTSL